MKLRILLSLFFFLGLTLASMHELEHINAEHPHPSCEICSINDSLQTPDLYEKTTTLQALLEKEITPKTLYYSAHPKANTNHPNAPPLLS